MCDVLSPKNRADVTVFCDVSSSPHTLVAVRILDVTGSLSLVPRDRGRALRLEVRLPEISDLRSPRLRHPYPMQAYKPYWQRLATPPNASASRPWMLVQAPLFCPIHSTLFGTARRLRAAWSSSHTNAFSPCVTPAGRVISARYQRPSAYCSLPPVRGTPWVGVKPCQCRGATFDVNFRQSLRGRWWQELAAAQICVVHRDAAVQPAYPVRYLGFDAVLKTRE